MKCPRCQHDNPPAAEKCASCNAPLELGGATLSGVGSPPGESSAVSVSSHPSGFHPGAVLNNRYEILDTLGEGGMGAVYKALDRELDRLVALKVIRPELASNPQVLQRFKNELVLARKVTHKNVNRIFDIGEAEGTKFISMEYVEGRELKSVILDRGKLPPEEAVPLVIQICQALDAAHSEEVVHRDLKPHNIMVDDQGKLQVMDFGLAASTEMTGFTQTGALLGTPEYMSPEQAKAEKADHRSDLFALGIIFYEMLTGETPYKTDSAYSSLLKRTQERAVPLHKLDADIPRHISDVVAKCLEIDARHRYQTALEIIEDLEAQRRPPSRSIISYLPFQLRTVTESRIWVKATAAAGAALAVVLLAVWLFWPSPPPPATEIPSLAVLPFQNASGNADLDWMGSGIADMLATDLGEAESIRTVPPDRLHQLLRDLRISSASTLDTAMLSRVAEFSSADLLVWGKYLKAGKQIRIDATLHDLQQNQTVSLKAEAPSEEDLLQAVAGLANSIHENLSGRGSAQLSAGAFQPATESMEALRFYNEGIALVRQGRSLEAVEKLETSIKADPEFALAHARLGQTYAALGYGWEAERFSRRAVELSGNLPDQQRYLILARHARITNDLDEARPLKPTSDSWGWRPPTPSSNSIWGNSMKPRASSIRPWKITVRFWRKTPSTSTPWWPPAMWKTSARTSRRPSTISIAP
jgi:serine/threonine protein kinase